MKKRVVIHIDRLVLNGFRFEDCHAIAQGLQQELSRLLVDPHSVQGLIGQRDISRLHVGGVHLAQSVKPQSVGVKVAQGIGKEFAK